MTHKGPFQPQTFYDSVIKLVDGDKDSLATGVKRGGKQVLQRKLGPPT